jgi:tetratricopeptide (TPR) repeat protein
MAVLKTCFPVAQVVRRRHPFLKRACHLALWCVWMIANLGRAGDAGFTNALAQAALAAKRGEVPAAVKIYGDAEWTESGNSAGLCVLARRYCDLMYLTNSVSVQKDLADRALACSLQAVKADSNNATAHACVAVCCAKECAFADVRAELDYSRRFKLEAEKTIALDPRQDIAYYLLGRWNYGVANVGLLSRTFVKLVYGGLPPASNADAIANFKKAIELAPDRIIHHAGLAMVYEATGQKQLELTELKKCRDLKPSGLEDQDAQRDAVKKMAALGQ